MAGIIFNFMLKFLLMRPNIRTTFILSILTLFSFAFLPACKKAVQKAQEDFVVNLIVNNTWVVTNFAEGSNNITASFTPYEFKFNRDETVFGKRTGQPDAMGTWKGDANSMTITAGFPSGPAPLNKLTGVWLITRTTLTSVTATRTEAGVVYNLSLASK
jgi:hypothetical protein